jgi:hypothetical protein
MAKTETSDTGVASNDAYTGLLAISLIALIVGSVLLFLDYSQHSATPPRLTGIPKYEAKKDDAKPPVNVPPLVDKDGKDAAVKDGKDAAKDAAAKDGVKDAEAK